MTALAWVVVARLALVYHRPLGDAALFFVLKGAAGVLIDTVLFVLNLLPLPPPDDGRVPTSLLPPPGRSASRGSGASGSSSSSGRS